MPRNFDKTPESLTGTLKALRVEIEREKLRLLKAKTAALPPPPEIRRKTLDERLKDFAPTPEELVELRRDLAKSTAQMALNDVSYLKEMLVHRREHECDDIELLETELRKHYAARTKREEEGRRAYDDCHFTGEEILSQMRKGGTQSAA